MKKVLVLLLFILIFKVTATPSYVEAADKLCCPTGMVANACSGDSQPKCYPILAQAGGINVAACRPLSGWDKAINLQCSPGETCDGYKCVVPGSVPACPLGQTNILFFNPLLRVNCTKAEVSELEKYCCEDGLCRGASAALERNDLRSCAVIVEEVKNSTATSPTTACDFNAGKVYDQKTQTCVQAANSGWDLMTGCISGTEEGVQTAIGCIPTGTIEDAGGFLMKWALGIAGGVILLMSLITAYTLMVSSGDPQKLQAVRENITSILTGLILIVFSLVLLQVVGANIISIPGLF